MLLGNPVHYSAYRNVIKGMKKSDVIKLLGRPSENKDFLIPWIGTVPPPKHVVEMPTDFGEILRGKWSNWIALDCKIVVVFDSDNKVIAKAYLEEEGTYISFILRLLRSSHLKIE